MKQEQYDANVNSKKQPVLQIPDEAQDVDLHLIIEQVLSDEECRLLTQYYIYGHSLEEISRTMNISYSALKVRLHRIRKKLKKYFQ